MRYLAAVDNLFPDRPSGSARVAWDIANAVRDAGHETTVLCRNSVAGGAAGPDRIEDIDVVRFDAPRTHPLSPRRYRATIESVAAAARRWLPAGPWDVAHLHTPLPGRGVLRALVRPSRVIYTLHSPVEIETALTWAGQGWRGRLKQMLARGPLHRMEHDLLQRCDAIHTLSEFTRGEVERLHGLGDRVTVIPHWRRDGETRSMSKAEARAKLGWPAETPILFTLRRHVYRMGLDTAVEAIAPLAAAGRCMFVAAGDGPYRSTFEQRARELGADETQVRFPGRISDDELAMSYQAADLFVLPTRALEGFGLIVVEAMSYGLPVLGTDVGAIPELVRPIAPALIVPAGDAGALGDRLKRWLDGSLVAPTPEAMAEYVDQRFDRAAVVPRQLELFGLGP